MQVRTKCRISRGTGPTPLPKILQICTKIRKKKAKEHSSSADSPAAGQLVETAASTSWNMVECDLHRWQHLPPATICKECFQIPKCRFSSVLGMTMLEGTTQTGRHNHHVHNKHSGLKETSTVGSCLTCPLIHLREGVQGPCKLLRPSKVKLISI